jgi:PRC-barrel domain
MPTFAEPLVLAGRVPQLSPIFVRATPARRRAGSRCHGIAVASTISGGGLMQQTAQSWNLCYLSAAVVGSPMGWLAQLAVCGRNGAELGTLDGILIDPGTRRLSHLVVQRGVLDGARRELIPVESLIYLTCDAGTARLEVDADALVSSDLDLEAIRLMGEAIEHWRRA